MKVQLAALVMTLFSMPLAFAIGRTEIQLQDSLDLSKGSLVLSNRGQSCELTVDRPVRVGELSVLTEVVSKDFFGTMLSNGFEWRESALHFQFDSDSSKNQLLQVNCSLETLKFLLNDSAVFGMKDQRVELIQPQRFRVREVKESLKECEADGEKLVTLGYSHSLPASQADGTSVDFQCVEDPFSSSRRRLYNLLVSIQIPTDFVGIAYLKSKEGFASKKDCEVHGDRVAPKVEINKNQPLEEGFATEHFKGPRRSAEAKMTCLQDGKSRKWTSFIEADFSIF